MNNPIPTFTDAELDAVKKRASYFFQRGVAAAVLSHDIARGGNAALVKKASAIGAKFKSSAETFVSSRIDLSDLIIKAANEIRAKRSAAA